MGCLSSAEVTRIKAEIAKLDLQIEAIEAAYLAALPNAEVEEYAFNSGDGRQSAIRRKPKELRLEIEALQASRMRLQRRLDGTLNVNMNLRRRRGGRYASYR